MIKDHNLNRLLQLDKVDAGNNTLFGTPFLKNVDKNHLTLVIGVGGSGLRIIQKAEKTFRQEMDPGYVNYVKLMVVDSDTSDLYRLADSAGIDYINLSSNGAQQRLTHPNRSEFYKKFVPKDYNIGLINSDGASQDRLTGKIKLYDINFSQHTTNDDVLSRKIKELFCNVWCTHRNLPLDVVILTSTTGGTGSGTFMDIAALVRNACKDYLTGHLSVYGYVMLSATTDCFAVNECRCQSMRGNGFAALKELESYLGMSAEPVREESFPSPSRKDSYVARWRNNLFDYVFLVSGNYEKAVSIATELIMNSTADTQGNFCLAALKGNFYWVRNNRLCPSVMLDKGVLKKTSFPEDSFRYCGIGYAKIGIPERESRRPTRFQTGVFWLMIQRFVGLGRLLIAKWKRLQEPFIVMRFLIVGRKKTRIT